jgi:hypothetical protein
MLVNLHSTEHWSMFHVMLKHRSNFYGNSLYSLHSTLCLHCSDFTSSKSGAFRSTGLSVSNPIIFSNYGDLFYFTMVAMRLVHICFVHL